MDATTSYKPEVIADNSGHWSSNSLRFASEQEAQEYVDDLARRWTLVTGTRVSPSTDPVTHRIDNAGYLTRVDG